MSQILEVFSIYDKKGNDYGVPFFQITAGVARRTLCDLVSDSRSFVAAHPEDYCLYRLGSYDSLSGHIESRIPEFIADALEFVNNRQGGDGGGSAPSPVPSATDMETISSPGADEVDGKDWE